MAVLIVSDCQVRATRLRQLLAQAGYDCPPRNVLPVEAIDNSVACIYPKPDLILFVLSSDPERAQCALLQLRESSDIPFVAVGPRDPNMILGALHAGAVSYLDETSDLQKDLSAVLARISSGEHRQSSAGRLVSVVSASGGSGRTLLATNLAVVLAKKHGRCALFDFDFQRADVPAHLNLKPRHSIADLCRNVDRIDQKMFDQSLLEHESGVSVLAAPESWDEPQGIPLDGLQKILRLGRGGFQDVVVDLNLFGMNDLSHLLQQSTAILLLVRLDFAAIRNARGALSIFERNGVDRAKISLVAARYGRPKEITVSQAESALGVKIRHFLPEDPQTANSCANCGVPIVLEAAGSSLAKAISSIADAVVLQGSEAAASGRNKGSLRNKVRLFLGLSLQELAHQ